MSSGTDISIFRGVPRKKPTHFPVHATAQCDALCQCIVHINLLSCKSNCFEVILFLVTFLGCTDMLELKGREKCRSPFVKQTSVTSCNQESQDTLNISPDMYNQNMPCYASSVWCDPCEIVVDAVDYTLFHIALRRRNIRHLFLHRTNITLNDAVVSQKFIFVDKYKLYFHAILCLHLCT